MRSQETLNQNLALASFALAAGLAVSVQAQTFSVLHTFTASPYATNNDGANPCAPLVISGDTLYGTALEGGALGNGTVFKLGTNGTGFTTLHAFTGSDGARPYAGLALSGHTLYGTTYQGGSSTNGTVFKINIDGTGFSTLHSFGAFFGYINSDGANPHAGLVLSSNILYGTAQNGGASGNGTVFKINTDGNGFAVLHSFTPRDLPPPYTNGDGAFPSSGLVLSGDVLYGTTAQGGDTGAGTTFKVQVDGTGFTILSGIASGSSLLLSGSTFFGTKGALFKFNTDGTGFTNFYTFTPTGYSPPDNYTNGDGQIPNGLILFGNTLFGTANAGGLTGSGTIFRVNTDGTGFTNLHNFGEPPGYSPDGCFPYAGLVLSGDALYGTAFSCGDAPGGNGTVFSFSLAPTNKPPQLSIIPFGASVILTWPTNATGFTLQSAPSLGSPVDWTNVPAGPVIVNGENTVLIMISDAQQFYRLSQ